MECGYWVDGKDEVRKRKKKRKSALRGDGEILVFITKMVAEVSNTNKEENTSLQGNAVFFFFFFFFFLLLCFASGLFHCAIFSHLGI